MSRFLTFRPLAQSSLGSRPLRRGFGLALLLAFSLHSLATASDGVVEINHTCASQTGCFAGDAPGYPVTINGIAGRSYRLTSDLAIPTRTDGIVISANSVRLDLGGFAVISDNCSSPALFFCQATPGSGIGISSTAGAGSQVSNGSVVGMNGACIQLADVDVVSNVSVRFCGGNGIEVGRAGSVLNCNVGRAIGAHGIKTGDSALVTGNTVFNVFGNGIDLGGSSSALDNVIDTCQGSGISAASGAALIARNTISACALRGIFVDAEGSTVSSNTVSSNTGDGIRVTQGSHVVDNTVFGNTANGILAFGASSIQRNAVRSNGGLGLSMSGSTVYRENVISNNTGGTVTGGVDLGSNSCDSTTSCP